MNTPRIITFIALVLCANTLMATTTAVPALDETAVLATRSDYQSMHEAYPQPRRSALIQHALQALMVNETLAMLDDHGTLATH